MKYNKAGTAAIFLIFIASGCIITNEMDNRSAVVFAQQQVEKQNGDIIIKELGEFIDLDGILNVVGVVDNNGIVPVNVVVGLNTTNDTNYKKQLALASNSVLSSPVSFRSNLSDSNNSISTLTEPLYGKVIYPDTGAPFKFKIEPGNQETM